MQAKLDRLKQEQLTPEQRLIKEIVADPTAIHAYVELADIYRNHGDLDKAEKVLAKGLKANPDDHGLMSDLRGHADRPAAKRAIDQPEASRAGASRGHRAKAKLDQLTEDARQVRDPGLSPPGQAPPRGRQAALRPRA